MEIHTTSGFVCNVNEKKAKDWRFAKALADCDSGDESRILRGMTFALPFLLGKEEQKLMDHVSDEDGVADSDKMMTEFNEILDFIGAEAKKSQASQE